MKLYTQKINKYNTWHLFKQKHSNGQSGQNFFFKTLTPLFIFYNKLSFKLKWNAGRNAFGKKILYTRGKKKILNKFFNINYKFRLSNLSFLTSFLFNTHSSKLISVLILSSGSIIYLITTVQHKIFSFTQFLSFINYKFFFYKMKNLLNISFFIGLLFFFLQYKVISLLELFPYKGIQYIRSTGVSGFFIKIDLYTKVGLIKLPSGVRKIFSIYSISSLGSISLQSNKYKINNRAGFLKKKGFKSLTRGIAMNPIDHPHGGRTKTIKYPRTPWGKTTKYK